MKTVNYALIVLALPLIVLALLLSACVTTGYISLQDAPRDLVTKHIVQGTTTKARVTKCFGKANSTSVNSSGQEVWVYKNHNSNSNDNFSSVKELVIVFDQNDVVSQFSVK
ncbi:MAG: hypothetical protein LZF63_06625 [Nitrosomonas sp.]|nr:hypothetical protein [Nitrosomonas sp.]